MSPREVPLRSLYIASAIFAMFAIGYGALRLLPSPAMNLLLSWGPLISIAWWLTADNRQQRVIGVFDAGLLFYLAWPLTLPWYALRSRGRAGWALLAQLYLLSLVYPLGLILGELLRWLGELLRWRLH
jgi:hypothetical protein